MSEGRNFAIAGWQVDSNHLTIQRSHRNLTTDKKGEARYSRSQRTMSWCKYFSWRTRNWAQMRELLVFSLSSGTRVYHQRLENDGTYRITSKASRCEKWSRWTMRLKALHRCRTRNRDSNLTATRTTGTKEHMRPPTMRRARARIMRTGRR